METTDKNSGVKTSIHYAKIVYTTGQHLGFCSRGGGQNSCFRIPGGASATCCTIQYIYI